MVAWSWDETNPYGTGSSGDFSKLFRGESTKNPGIFAHDPPSLNATVLAREVIQNSWDAARELQAARPDAPDFHIEFEFDEVAGDAKRSLVEQLDLRNLQRRASEVSRQELGLRETDCLEALGAGPPLPYLRITETGTTGMDGPFAGGRSKMFKALISLGYTEKTEHAGGSFGYGKAGLIRGSAIHTVVAYTCFEERNDDPGVTRRLLGVVYWGQHPLGETNYTGLARLGRRVPQGVVPFENEDADQIAAGLNLPLRIAADASDLGTTFLLIEPTVASNDLLGAIERSWWPALIDDGKFSATVRAPDGQIHHPRPRRDVKLNPFIRAFEIATMPQDNVKAEERVVLFQPISAENERFENPGALGMVADLDGWSYADEFEAHDDSQLDQRSLIALIREPRMVVEYFEAGRTAPYIRGAFIAGSTIDGQLRLTEPKGHDAWQTNLLDGQSEIRASHIATTVLERIKAQVRIFRGLLKPPTPPPERLRLPVFDEVVRRLMSGKGRGQRPPIADTRPVTIRLHQKVTAMGPDSIRLEGRAEVGLSDHFKDEATEVVVSIRYRFMEDDRVGVECPLSIGAPGNFDSTALGEYRGVLAKGANAAFAFASEIYQSDWTGRLFVNAEVAALANSDQT